MKIPGLRHSSEQLGGLVFFGRMLDKIRLHAQGKLPSDYKRGIGTDSRNVSQPLDSGSERLSCYALGSLDVHGMKSLPSVLDVKTDCIYHAVSAGKGMRD